MTTQLESTDKHSLHCRKLYWTALFSRLVFLCPQVSEMSRFLQCFQVLLSLSPGPFKELRQTHPRPARWSACLPPGHGQRFSHLQSELLKDLTQQPTKSLQTMVNVLRPLRLSHFDKFTNRTRAHKIPVSRSLEPQLPSAKREETAESVKPGAPEFSPIQPSSKQNHSAAFKVLCACPTPTDLSCHFPLKPGGSQSLVHSLWSLDCPNRTHIL